MVAFPLQLACSVFVAAMICGVSGITYSPAGACAPSGACSSSNACVWTSSTSWSPAGVPGLGDDVIVSQTSVCLSFTPEGAASIQSLTLVNAGLSGACVDCGISASVIVINNSYIYWTSLSLNVKSMSVNTRWNDDMYLQALTIPDSKSSMTVWTTTAYPYPDFFVEAWTINLLINGGTINFLGYPRELISCINNRGTISGAFYAQPLGNACGVVGTATPANAVIGGLVTILAVFAIVVVGAHFFVRRRYPQPVSIPDRVSARACCNKQFCAGFWLAYVFLPGFFLCCFKRRFKAGYLLSMLSWAFLAGISLLISGINNLYYAYTPPYDAFHNPACTWPYYAPRCDPISSFNWTLINAGFSLLAIGGLLLIAASYYWTTHDRPCCGDCGQDVDLSASFCPRCSAPLSSSLLKSKITCSECGVVNQPGARFCSKCAQPLLARGQGKKSQQDTAVEIQIDSSPKDLELSEQPANTQKQGKGKQSKSKGQHLDKDRDKDKHEQKDKDQDKDKDKDEKDDSEEKHAKVSADDAGAPEVEIKPVSEESDEYARVDERVSAHINGQNVDYNESRIKQGLRPISFRLTGLWSVDNPTLRKRLNAKLEELKHKGRSAAQLKLKVGFHGCKRANITKICTQGLLPIGHALNKSKAVDGGYFGAPTHGVNLTRYIDYGLKYSNGLEPLKPGEEAKIIMFDVLPGHSKHLKKVTMGVLPTEGYDSHSSANHLEWFLFDPAQCCPTYIVRVRAFENRRTAADDEEQDIGKTAPVAASALAQADADDD